MIDPWPPLSFSAESRTFTKLLLNSSHLSERERRETEIERERRGKRRGGREGRRERERERDGKGRNLV